MLAASIRGWYRTRMSFPLFLPHEELLLAMVQRSAVPAQLGERVALLNEPHLRAAFERHAGQHEVLGLALTVLERIPEHAAVLSEDAATALFAPLSRLRRQAAFWDLERGRVLYHLQASGVDPVVLKGGALRLTTYHDSVERSLGDLDVLVREREIEVAIAALEAAGYAHGYGDVRPLYQQHHFHFILQHPRGFTVELHWALSPPAGQVQLEADVFRERSVRLNVPYPARVPSPEDMVLHLVCQNLEDGFGKLRRIVDVDRIVSQHGDLDWPYLVDAAVRSGAYTAAALALQLSRRLLGTRLPQDNAADLFHVSRMARAGLAPVRPVAVHAHRLERGGDLRRELLLLWTARGSKSWFWALRQRLSADYYRFWTLASGQPQPVMLQRGVHIVKLLVLQVWCFATASVGLMTRRGRMALRFWTA